MLDAGLLAVRIARSATSTPRSTLSPLLSRGTPAPAPRCASIGPPARRTGVSWAIVGRCGRGGSSPRSPPRRTARRSPRRCPSAPVDRSRRARCRGSTTSCCARPASRCPSALGGLLHHRDLGAGLPRLRRPPHRPHLRVQPRVPEPARRRRPPGRRGAARGDARLVREQRLRRRALRRRLVGGVGREPAGGRRRRHGRPRPARPRPRDRRTRHGRRASRPACSARTLEDQLRPPATPCATSRSRSASRRSAVGSRPVRAGTTPRTTPTSTTSSSRCACSRRKAGGSRGACPARAPARHPTGW